DHDIDPRVPGGERHARDIDPDVLSRARLEAVTGDLPGLERTDVRGGRQGDFATRLPHHGYAPGKRDAWRRLDADRIAARIAEGFEPGPAFRAGKLLLR